MNRYHDKLRELMGVVRDQGASDLHLSIGRYPTIRVDGTLIPLTKETVLQPQDTFEFMAALLSEDGKKSFIEKKEIDFSYSLDKDTRFRCNCFMQRGGVGIALRYIPRDIPSLKDLGLPEILKEFAMKQQGFFLVVGPVGQGKTTTLASLIQLINKERQEHIVTIEDPIEYLHGQGQSIIDQREVGTDTDSFAEALHSAFRQDVNVILVGEMRGTDTMASAVTAAETGHLVLATLHTNDAVQTVDRIIDSFPAAQQNQIRSQLSASLTGIFSQRLLPRIGGGLVPAYELLINNHAVANLIRDGRTHELPSVLQTSSERGMISMESTLAELVRKQEITIETARAHSIHPDILERLI